ncbi:MAG TPA: hypothetical protein VF881_06685 [Polyangiaceae bacterium]
MKDPRRWIEDPTELDDAEHRALVAGRNIRPQNDTVETMWTALAAKLPLAGPTAGSAGAAGAVGTIKAALIGMGLGSLVIAGKILIAATPSTPVTASSGFDPSASEVLGSPHAPLPMATEPRDEAPPPDPGPAATLPQPKVSPPSLLGGGRRDERLPEPASLPEKGSRSPPAEQAYAASPATTVGSAVAMTTEDARQESWLVARAREALRAGQASAAFALLEQTRQRFPQGVLLQEREALTIEALVQLGQRRAALERASAFSRDYPTSPHRMRVQAIVSAP